MFSVPNSAHICEVGPRDGLQIERKALTVEQRIRMIDDLVACGFTEIEVGSFVNPKAVPQMADTDKVLDGLQQRNGVAYRTIFLNARGLNQALASGKTEVLGRLHFSASDTFIRRNTNRSSEQTFAEFAEWIELYEQHHIDVTMIAVMAAFGCNFEGYIPEAKVIEMLKRAAMTLEERGHLFTHVTLADTMGWANPQHVKRMIGGIREIWPDLTIRLHLHDTRGAAIANAVAALELGVTEFEAAVGGLGGCPFAGHRGAAGNVCTEDLVFAFEEMGVSTGIDLDLLVETSIAIEALLGHALPGKVMKGGTVTRYKPGARGRPTPPKSA